MKLHELCLYLDKLESTSKRLEITDILATLISKLDIQEIDKAVYLSLGYLKAPYESEKFNIADKMMIKILSRIYANEEDITKEYSILGDLGDVAYKLHQQQKAKDLEIVRVYQNLLDIAQASGTGSQENKISKSVELLKSLDSLSAKFIIRIILGTTRLGFTELTIINALTKFVGKDKFFSQQIEDKYSLHPDIGLISKLIKENNQNPIKALDKIDVATGVPILAQKAQRLGTIQEIVQKLGDCWAEYKFDGTRVQLHLDRNKRLIINQKQSGLFESDTNNDFLVKTFTRNLEDTTHQYPDLVSAAKKQISAQSIILDGEVIGIDKNTGEFLPFQQIMQRKRKHSIKEYVKDIPIKYFVFDILYLNGESLVGMPLQERRKLLESKIKDGNLIRVAEKSAITSQEDLEEYFEEAKMLNLEGLIIKKPKDKYQAGARSFSWVKLKKADEKLLKDSIDVVVLGYYFGKGTRAKFGIGKFLVGVFDETTQKYVTLTKVGTGLTDEDWAYIKKQADRYKTIKIPQNIDITKMYTPDVILLPKIVVEIGGDEITISQSHSSSYGLRFPRLLKFREDKNPSQITSLKEIEKLYSLQERGKYN